MELYKGKVIHAGTFNGYPLGLAAVLATLELLEKDTGCYERMGKYLTAIGQSMIDAAKAVGMPMVVQGMPTALVFHSQETPVTSEGYPEKTKTENILIKRVIQDYGLLCSPVSRLYGNLMMNDDDVCFFEDRIGEALSAAKEVLRSVAFLD